ncbi:hypothetical protein DERP_001993 [Dermatophagoides pteronyssinus]|uniref:Uncharacterized protein n=1 Tax=Dermatophagoides pteronyssinus TaxID=6956 RepID=A0ABQ8JHA4_DERPT|nr:hypothetical protein DERP_001993 [Dermatophagoides pteronyssinus]
MSDNDNENTRSSTPWCLLSSVDDNDDYLSIELNRMEDDDQLHCLGKIYCEIYSLPIEIC